MALARLTLRGAAPAGMAGLLAASLGCGAGSQPQPAEARALAASPAPSSAPAPPSFKAASVRRIASREQGLAFALPEPAGWRRDKSEPQSWVVLHSATSSRLLARVWQEPRPMRSADCEQRARSWRRDLPVFSPGELLEARPTLLAESYTGELRVAVQSEDAAGGAMLSGHVLAIASDARSCMLVAFSTRAPAAASGAARVVAERLSLMTRIIERVQRLGIGDRVRVPRL